ncbi:hypothetical protein BDF20DRAFT_813462, partial [Mycotypha africana]|uniref:uncharacterized protein n=1 Tax=Mycotypha africana TaxID=64632 RepID=UPI0023000B23
LFFEDYHFPQELYNKDTGDFTTPIRTLLDFTPHILQQLPKDTKDQKPIKSEDEDFYTHSNKASSGWKSYIKSIAASERSKALAEFVIRCGTEYLNDSSEEEEELEEMLKKERRRRQRDKEDSYGTQREKRAKTQQQQQQQVATSSTTSTIAKSAAAASVLSLSLYSTYQASLKFSEVSFHNQLEILINQIQSIVQSTEIWIEEHEKLGDPVSDRIRNDVVQIKQIIEYLTRLDPRANKKMEAAGWGCGAIGGLSAVGGFALGSAAAMTGGAVLALGGAAVMISSKAFHKSQLGARLLLENQVRERVSSCQNSLKERKKVIRDYALNKHVKKETSTEDKSANPPQANRRLLHFFEIFL